MSEPADFDELVRLGTLAAQARQFGRAAEYFTEAANLRPEVPDVHRNLGAATLYSGNTERAVVSLQRALSLRPVFPQALELLARALAVLGRVDEAVDAATQRVRQRPGAAPPLRDLAALLATAGRHEESVQVLEELVKLSPAGPDVLLLGEALLAQLKLAPAITALRRAVELMPADGQALCSLGIALLRGNQAEEAIAVFRRILDLFPDSMSAANNLVMALKEQGRHAEYMALLENHAALFDRNAELDSNRALNVHYPHGISPQQIYWYHTGWNRRHGLPLCDQLKLHENLGTTDRPLRVGYVSPDFAGHVVARFFLPLIAHHDRANFEVFCYSNVVVADGMTARFKSLSTKWRDVRAVSDPELIQQIREDRIDVLVDLAGHTAGNRLTMFACKPAPVQVTYLGYPNTTGLTAIDYRLTDALADPPGMTDGLCSERLVRLPHGAWCYAPDSDAPPVASAPSLTRGFITFGCFNAAAKINDWTLRLWARVLKGVPRSRLVLKARSLNDPAARRRIIERLCSEGIEQDRLELLGPAESQLAHLQCYERMDIALDPFPYHGTTTTCEALWMGVPVVTLAGETHVSRVGVSLMTRIELENCIGWTPDQYVERAAELAADVRGLGFVRRALRERMRDSPLMDGEQFARDVEAEYRRMWEAYCRGTSVGC